MPIGERLQKMIAYAELRGPVVFDDEGYPDDPDLEDYRELPRLPPLSPEVLDVETPEERAKLASGCAGLDCETFLIQHGRVVPRLVVTGYQSADGRQAIVTGDPNDPTVHARAFLMFTARIVGVVDDASMRTHIADEQLAEVERVHDTYPLGNLLVNQNIAFDFCVIAEDAHQCDILLGLVGHPDSWFDKVMRRIFALLDAGLVEDTQLRERLIDLAEGTLGKDFENKTPKGTPRRKFYNLKALAQRYLNVELDKFTWRTGYSRFLNKSVAEYPDGARKYLTDDVEKALAVATQQQARVRLNGLAPGKRIPNSAEQSKAAFALNLVSAYGMRTDLAKVQQLDADLDRASRSMLRVLQEHGLVRMQGKGSGTRDIKRIHALVKKTYEDAGLPVPYTKSGKNISMAGAVLEDIALIKLRGSPKDVLDENGQIDETELFQQPLYALSQYTSIQNKLIGTYLPVLYAGSQYPINTRFETILETGRISSYKPNMNQFPRGGSKTLLARLQARVRQCFVPREGFYFCSVDYSALELCTLAQVLIWLFGASKMADAINAGFDLHLLFAAEQLLHIPYDEAKARKKEKNVGDMRQLAKVCNFGLGSNMGPPSLAEYAKAAYNVYLTEDEAREAKQAWLRQWPEMHSYFRWVSAQMRGFDEYGKPVGDLEQFWSGRIRGGARYCALANSLFQGLAADGAKRALYELVKQCYLLGGSLYGSRVVAFFYDEFLMEHPIDKASERGQIQADIAKREMQDVCKDVTIGAEPALMEFWMKEAEPVYDANKRLIPYRPQQMAA